MEQKEKVWKEYIERMTSERIANIKYQSEYHRNYGRNYGFLHIPRTNLVKDDEGVNSAKSSKVFDFRFTYIKSFFLVLIYLITIEFVLNVFY